MYNAASSLAYKQPGLEDEIWNNMYNGNRVNWAILLNYDFYNMIIATLMNLRHVTMLGHSCLAFLTLVACFD